MGTIMKKVPRDVYIEFLGMFALTFHQLPTLRGAGQGKVHLEAYFFPYSVVVARLVGIRPR